MPKKSKRNLHTPRGTCFYCKKPVFKRATGKPGEILKHNQLTIDHKIPIAKGGKNTRSNKVIACHSCNNLKGSMTQYEFYDILNKKQNSC